MTPTLAQTLTAAEQTELRAFKAAMNARDRAMEPERNAAGILSELSRTIATHAKIRESAYEIRDRVKSAIKVRGGSNFDLRHDLAQAESDARAAEAVIRSTRAAIEHWRPIADRQRREKQERQEREAKIEKAQRKAAGLGLE